MMVIRRKLPLETTITCADTVSTVAIMSCKAPVRSWAPTTVSVINEFLTNTTDLDSIDWRQFVQEQPVAMNRAQRRAAKRKARR